MSLGNVFASPYVTYESSCNVFNLMDLYNWCNLKWRQAMTNPCTYMRFSRTALIKSRINNQVRGNLYSFNFLFFIFSIIIYKFRNTVISPRPIRENFPELSSFRVITIVLEPSLRKILCPLIIYVDQMCSWNKNKPFKSLAFSFATNFVLSIFMRFAESAPKHINSCFK